MWDQSSMGDPLLITDRDKESTVYKDSDENTQDFAVRQNVINMDQIDSSVANTESSTSEEVDITGLKSYLFSDYDGLAIIKKYEKFGILLAKEREHLVHKIIKREEDILFSSRTNIDKELPQFSIKTERFQDLAKDIVSIFPNESTVTYYKPFKTVRNTDGTTSRINAAGKLYEHFSYRKNLLKGSGVIASSKKFKKFKNISTISIRKATGDEEVMLEFLCDAKESNSLLFDYWKETFEIRRAEFHGEENRTDLIFQKYKCLQMNFGFELLKIDFELLLPGKSDIFTNRWPLIRKRLAELFQGARKPKKGHHCALVEELKHLTPDEQDPIILCLLSTIIKPKNPGRSLKTTDKTPDEILPKRRKLFGKDIEKTRYKPSESEIQKAFFLLVVNVADMDRAIKRRREDLKKRGLSVQVLPIFVGTFKKIVASYVYIDSSQSNGYKYCVESPMHAIDLSLKIYYVLNYSYPLDATHLWVFIQHVGFLIEDADDKLSASSKTLKGEIEVIFNTN